MYVAAQNAQAFGPNFGYVMIIATLISIQVVIFARIFGGMPRKVFNRQFMETNFGRMHKQAFGQQIGGGGHPDTGSGFYSQKLSYKQWWEFNNSQRAHLHFVEWIATYLFLLVSAGSYFPLSSASIGLAIFLVRIWYSAAYVLQGPKGRVIPFIINILLTVALSCISIASGVKHTTIQ